MSAHKWAIPLLVTVALLASTCTVASAQGTQGGVVKISSPPNNGKVGPTERVSGKAQLSKGYSLWIVPHDPTSGKYYPEAPSVTIRSDASWSSRLSVGTIFGVGKTFQIYAVVADQSASTALRSYAAQRTAIAKLPSGAQAVDAVTVKRVAADVTGAPSVSTSTVSRTASTAGSSATAGASSSTTNVPQASVAASSSNPLPGFEVVYALGALAAVFLALRVTRRG